MVRVVHPVALEEIVSVQSITKNRPVRSDAPRYGEAAAIYAMYQGPFIERETARKQPPPRKPGGGLRERLAAAVSSLIPAPAYARVTP